MYNLSVYLCGQWYCLKSELGLSDLCQFHNMVDS